MASPTEISFAQLSRLIGLPDCPALIDVRVDEDFARNPRLIPNSVRHSHKSVEQWANAYHEQPCVVICQKGLKLSHGVADILRLLGIKAEVLEGGFEAWQGAKQVLCLPLKQPSLWVTRERPKVDRIACPWLIRRFIDRQAKILFVAYSEVLAVAERFGALAFDVEDAPFTHDGPLYSFDALLKAFELQTPTLLHLARIIRAADTDCLRDEPQAAGFLAA